MISVFMYHDIRDDTKYPKRYGLKSFLDVKNFKKHLDHIMNKYQVIKSSDITKVIDDDKGKYCVLTFDDGLKDHYNVTESLLTHNINGTFLIPTLPVTDGKMIHSHKIQFLMAVDSEVNITKKILCDVENPSSVFNHYSKSIVKNNWWSSDMIFITNFLRHHENGVTVTNKLFNDIVTNDEKGFCENFYLNENDIVEMVSNGMEIGGHGYTSTILTNNNQKSEIQGSIDFISRMYDGDVMFSYPNGVYNEDTVELLEQYKCKYAFTTEPTTITNSNINKLKLPRLDGSQTLLI